MAEEKLNTIAELIVEKSIVDAYIDVVGNNINHETGGRQNESMKQENHVCNDEAINDGSFDPVNCMCGNGGTNMSNRDEVLDNEPISLREAPKDQKHDDKNGSHFQDLKAAFVATNETPLATENEKMEDVKINERRNGKSLAMETATLEYDASDESENTDELISSKKSLIIESDSSKEREDCTPPLTDDAEIDHAEEKKQKITCSTPIKKGKSEALSNPKSDTISQKALLNDCASNIKLSSNLAVMIGDISGIDNGVYSDAYATSPVSLLLSNNHQGTNKNKEMDAFVPSTLDLSDLDLGSVDSYKDFSFNKNDKQRSLNGDKSHENGINNLRMYYEKELQKINHEKDEMMPNLRSPSHESALLRLHYTEDVKKELERRCFQSERRNHELSMENRRLQGLCFEFERKNRILEADKTILQERNFKIDQERRKMNNDLSAVQELLSKSLSDRRLLEDELFYAKKKEFDSTSRLSDSDATMRELKEDLNVSKRDCADKDEIIKNLTTHKQEIQENLNDAIEQISRLEDASSQRAREKNLFHKLLEEYEVLYNQHHRIRSLYNEALQRLDDSVEEVQKKSGHSKSNLSIKMPTRGSPFRKKWSMSPTSPSLREQNESEKFPHKDNSKNNEFEDHHENSRRSPVHRMNKDISNRHSVGSILSWETSKDIDNNNNNPYSHYNNNNNDSINDTNSRTFSPRETFSRSRNSEQRWSYHGNYTTYSDGEEKMQAGNNKSQNKDENTSKGKDWVVQNVNGITRFDVVFSPSKFKYEEAERDVPKEKDFTRHQSPSPFMEKEIYQEMENEARNISSEISELERDLAKLSAEKNEIESQLRRLPTNRSGRARRSNAEKQELLEERLDEVVKYIGNIRMTLKRHKAL